MELKIGDEIENFILEMHLKPLDNNKHIWKAYIKDSDIYFNLTIKKKEIIDIEPIINQIISFGDDKFIIKKMIGDGTYGSVNIIQDIKTDRLYAIKFFKETSEAIREYKYYIKLFNCPYIPQIYYKTNNCIVMNKFEDNLYHKKLYSFDILNISKNILSAISFMHQQNIVHGDIKLENILIDNFKNGYLCDFSNSFNVNSFVEEISTIYYRAPENCDPANNTEEGYIIDTPSDIWSFGITFLAMFNKGSVPKYFKVSDPDKLYNRISTQSDIDGEIEDVIENNHYFIDFAKLLLNVDPKKRITAKNALEILNNIKEF